MKKARTSNQKRSSTSIAIGFVALVGAIWYGSKFYNDHALANQHFDAVTPGRVNIVGIDPGAGYQIIVANQMAQLVQASGGFGGAESDSGGATEGSIKKRIPMKELLEVVHGDSKAVGPFVMNLNDMSENEGWPPVRVIWTAEDLNKAFAGDQKLKTKLENDLNVHLDGTPLSTLRISSLESGIILDYPVTVSVSVDGTVRRVTGRVEEPYKPRFCLNVEAQYKDKQVTTSTILGYYATERASLKADPKLTENVEKVIQSHISADNATQLAVAAERVLKTAVVVINEKYITSASHTGYDTARGKMFDLTVDLNDEGRMRLWKYSHDKVGSHLLLVADGIPIAAPVIRNELSKGELTITQMQDEGLLKDAEASLNNQTTKEGSH
jgi:hypothetical protein